MTPRDRRSGILLHPTSLPGPHGIGELGAEARAWIDFLAAAGQRAWQVMPLGPTGYGDSPYQCFSSFAGNPYLIDLGALAEEGWLASGELEPLRALPERAVDFGTLIPLKVERLTLAADRFLAGASAQQRAELAAFVERSAWLEDFALFMAVKNSQGGRAWGEWPAPLRDRQDAALAAARAELAGEIRRIEVWQFWFSRQWDAVKEYANARGVLVIGDVPIFVSLDSADAWANRELFHLGEDGGPVVVAGVPPDYFSATGQRWGNPLYRWDVLASRGFDWWIERVRAALTTVDLLRIDHFRGFAAYWEIPASEPTAVKGRWVDGPGQALFDALAGALGELPLIAEDLGVITPDVEELRDANGLPGMKVLQFAFGGGSDDPYLPHNYPRNAVVYTGTHDNDTTRGWYAAAPAHERDFVRRYLARDDERLSWDLIRLALASTADLAIVPLQDVLDLGPEARMNTPGVASGNWSWRFTWHDVPTWVAPELAQMSELYGRLPTDGPTDTAYRQSQLTS